MKIKDSTSSFVRHIENTKHIKNSEGTKSITKFKCLTTWLAREVVEVKKRLDKITSQISNVENNFRMQRITKPQTSNNSKDV